MKLSKLLPLLIFSFTPLLSAQEAQWIWHTKNAADGEVRFFRKEFTLEALPSKAKLSASCDNEEIVYVNGHEVGQSADWKQPVVADIGKLLRPGANVIAVRGKNHEGIAALVVRVDLEAAGGAKSVIVTDTTWQSSEKEAPNWTLPGFSVQGWAHPVVMAAYGGGPWGDVLSGGGKVARREGSGNAPTPAEELATLPGFKVEMVLSADKDKHGSWISLARDDKGRLLLGSQTGNKITRLTLKDGKVAQDEDLQLPFSDAMGMLWAYGSLYINGNGKATDGKAGHGVYRLHDTKGDGHYDQIEQILEWGNRTGGGEHGSHGIAAGPDGKLYIVSGNFTDPPANLSSTSPHRNYAEDFILGRAEDGNGFGANRKPPGGFILRMAPDGKNPELFASGERNTYDIAFNPDGEILSFDSDMEWDWGMPWYRPIRIYHAVSGGDQGFREGTGKWPEYYPDSLPAVVNIGIGSPTGVLFGAGAKFPAKYQRAFYALDWTYGRLIAAHLQPKGATYTAEWENFVAPKSLQGDGPKHPLNLTDAVIGEDGALYFTIGGRGTQAALYRVSYTGAEPTIAIDCKNALGEKERGERRQLEAFHGHADAKAVPFAWPYLSSPDRFLRYGARIAIESQPVAEWKDRALRESNPTTALTALLALARLGGPESQPALVAALARIPMAGLSEEDQVAKIRVVEVSASRNGVPERAEDLVKELDAVFPAKSIALNRELAQTLIALNAPDAVAKSARLMQAAPTQEEQITYLLFLRLAKVGWTPALHTAYFDWWVHRPKAGHPAEVLKWFADAGRPYSDGSSFPGFLSNLHRDAEQSLSSQEIDQLQPVLAAYIPPKDKPPRKPNKIRAFVKMWTMEDLDPLLPQTAKGRNFDNGRDAYAASQCVLCHRFADEGGAVGPDLTAISSRFSMHDILESIIDPSKVVSEQYANEEFALKNGDIAVGRIVGETPESVTLRPSLLAPDLQQVKKADIKSHAPSKVSPMPPGLLSMLSKDDVLDLLAYLASGGKKDAPAFSK